MGDEKITPEGHLVVDLETKETRIPLGLLEDPARFDVGVSPSLGDMIVINFVDQQGQTNQALGFRGKAAEKLLQSFYTLLVMMHGAWPGDGEDQTKSPKKKITLH